MRLKIEQKKRSKNLKRQRIRNLRVKIDFLRKSQREKINIKLDEIRLQRKEKLMRFRINYLPLCLDEDLERYAKYFAEEEGNI